jgi:outer membrane protein assembly factor BamB
MNTSHRFIVGALVLSGLTVAVAAQNAGPDWPQWRGPRRDGTLTGFTEPKAWPDALTQRWKITVGLGYSTPILVGDAMF